MATASASATTLAEQEGGNFADEWAAAAVATTSAAASAFGEWATIAGINTTVSTSSMIDFAVSGSSSLAGPLSYAQAPLPPPPPPPPPPRRAQPQQQQQLPLLWRSVSASEALPQPQRWSSPDATLQGLIAPPHMAAEAELGAAAAAARYGRPASPWLPAQPQPQFPRPVESLPAAAAAAYIYTPAGDYPPPLPFDGTFIAADLPLGSAGFVLGGPCEPSSPLGSSRHAGGQCFLSATGEAPPQRQQAGGISGHQRRRGGGSGSTAVSMASSYTSGGGAGHLLPWGSSNNASLPHEAEDVEEEEDGERLPVDDGELEGRPPPPPPSSPAAAPGRAEGGSSRTSVFSKVLGRVI